MKTNKDSYSDKLGQKIRERRKNQDMTLSLLAKRTGISKSYLSNIETGKVDNPSINAFKKIANALRLELTDLLELRDSKNGQDYSGSYAFPSTSEELEELNMDESKKTESLDKKTINTLQELQEILTDPEIPIKETDDMEDKILSYARWLQEKAKDKVLEEATK